MYFTVLTLQPRLALAMYRGLVINVKQHSDKKPLKAYDKDPELLHFGRINL